MSIIEKKSDLYNNMVTWRHHLHQRPELSFKEEITSDYIASVLQSHDIEIHRGLAVTGIVATIHGKRKGGSIGLRADMDALPIQEKIILAISQSMRERCMHVAMMGTQQCFLVRQFILKSIMILLEPFI